MPSRSARADNSSKPMTQMRSRTRGVSESESESESESDASDASDPRDRATTPMPPSRMPASRAPPRQPRRPLDVPVHRVLLATSQEAQYWRRLRGALETWAARLPAAKGAAVRDFATRASPDVFITAEAEKSLQDGEKGLLGVQTRLHRNVDRQRGLGARRGGAGVLVPLARNDSQLSQSLTCSDSASGRTMGPAHQLRV